MSSSFCFLLLPIFLQLPDIAVAHVHLAYLNISPALFGPEALTSDGVCLRDAIQHIIEALVVSKWGRVRKSIDRERTRLGPLKEKVEVS